MWAVTLSEKQDGQNRPMTAFDGSTINRCNPRLAGTPPVLISIHRCLLAW